MTHLRVVQLHNIVYKLPPSKNTVHKNYESLTEGLTHIGPPVEPHVFLFEPKNKQINEKILGAKLLLQHWKPLKKQHVDCHDQLQSNKLWHETNPGMLSYLSLLIHITTCSMTGIITIQLSCTLSACLLRVLHLTDKQPLTLLLIQCSSFTAQL